MNDLDSMSSFGLLVSNIISSFIMVYKEDIRAVGELQGLEIRRLAAGTQDRLLAFPQVESVGPGPGRFRGLRSGRGYSALAARAVASWCVTIGT